MRLAQNGFFLKHGMESSVGFPNGPGMYQLAGVFALFGGTTPEYFAIWALLFSVTAPLGLCIVLYRQLGRQIALTAALLLAGTPMLIFLGANLWPPVFLPIFGIGILYLTSEAWRRNDVRFWCGACVLTAVTGSIHLSAFFLVPGLLLIFFCKRWNWWWIPVAGLAGAVILAPWLWYLIFEWEYQRFPDPSSGMVKTWHWFREIINCFGGGFLAEYYGDDWIEGLRNFFTAPGSIVLLLIAAGLPWCGALWAVWIMIRRKKEVPIPVYCAVILVGSLLCGYLLLGVHVYFFYLFLVMPFLCVIAAWGWGCYQSGRLRNCILIVWCASALLIAGGALFDMKQGFGHPLEYGPSYDFWRLLRMDLQELETKNGVLKINFQISRRAGSRFSPGVVRFLLGNFMQKEGIPLLVRIDYDPEKRQFVRNIIFLREIRSFPQKK